MRILLLTVSSLLMLSACRDESVARCESYMKNKTYLYESSCACIINAAKQNKVQNVDGFLSVLWNAEKVRHLLSSDLFQKNAGAINTSHINAIKDVAENCQMSDPQPDTRNILTNFNGKFSGVFNDKPVCMTKSDNAAEIQPYLYAQTTMSGLTPMVLEHVENRHVRAALQSVREGNEQTFAELDDSLSENNRLLLISAFNIDFSRAFFYYKKWEHQSTREAIDNAYFQSYKHLVNLIKNQGEQITPYLSSSFEFYTGSVAVENKCIPLNAPAIVDALKNINQ